MIIDTKLAYMFQDRNLRFPNKPKLVSDIRVFELPDGLGVHVRGGELPLLLRGPAVERIADYLLDRMDGSKTVNELIAEIPNGMSQNDVANMLLTLHAKALLERGDKATSNEHDKDPALSRQLLFWGRHAPIMRNADGGSELQRRLASSQILFIGTGLFGATTFDVLARSGCGAIDVIDWDDDGAMLDSIAAAVAPPRRSAHLSTTSLDQLSQTVLEWIDASDLVVTATREAPWALFERLNLLCLERMRPLLRANVNGADLDFGPHVIPFDSACIACVRARQMSADPHAVENELVELASAEIRSAGVTPPLGESIVLATQFAGLVGTEAIKIITRVAAPSYVNMVTIVSPFAGRSIESHVLRVPRCFACSRRGQLRVQHQGGFTHA